MITFKWTAEPTNRADKVRYVLRTPDRPEHHFSPLCADDRVGVCSRWTAPRTWRASFFTGYDSIWCQAGTAVAAIRLLERELCKRSIGLFGEDDVAFERAA